MPWRCSSTTLVILALVAGCGWHGTITDEAPTKSSDPDAGTDPGTDPGTDAGTDAGTDSGLDSGPDTSTPNIDNPYADVDWATFERYRANFHTHTTQSDGTATPDTVIDLYHELDYKILALTDHDTTGPESTTWPWSSFDRDPAELGMVAIEANELSRHHHTGSFYNDYGGSEIGSLDEALDEVAARGGTAVLFHPGRYAQPIEWYVDLFQQHEQLIGTEVVNQVDRYPEDRARWDAMLSVLMPQRTVWAFSNDDMHVPDAHLGYSWNVMLVPKLWDASVRYAMEHGHFYWVHAPEGPDGPSVPVINTIEVDADSRTITINADHTEQIHWMRDGGLVHEGASVDLGTLPGAGAYIRAELYGAGGSFAGTQAFGLSAD